MLKIFPELQRLKNEAIVAKESIPFLYQFFNIQAFYAGTETKGNIMSRLLNSFIEALNENTKLPRYVIMIPDWDIVRSTNFDYGATTMFEEMIGYLCKQINKCITRCRDDIMSKKPGALSSTFEPRVIWICMINRPIEDSKDMKELMIHRGKFNRTLDNNITKERYMYIMNINAFEEDSGNLLNANFHLTKEGKQEFWSEVSQQLKRFEYNEINLKPVNHKKKKSTPNNNHFENRWHLPKPPPRKF